MRHCTQARLFIVLSVLIVATAGVAGDELPRVPATSRLGDDLAALPPQVQLIVAAHNLDVEKVRRLLAAGADVNGRLEGKWFEPLRRTGEIGWLGIDMLNATPLLAVAYKEVEDDKVKLPQRERNFKKESEPTSSDALNPSVQIARMLLERGAQREARNRPNATALILAAARGNAPLVQLLVEKGADVNARGGIGFDGSGDQTPLHVAVEWPEIVRSLLAAGADPTLRDTDQATPVYLADVFKQSESRRLMETYIRDKMGQNPERAHSLTGRTKAERAAENAAEAEVEAKRFIKELEAEEARMKAAAEQTPTRAVPVPESQPQHRKH